MTRRAAHGAILRRLIIVSVAIILLAAGAVALTTRPWRPWLYGTVEPPRAALGAVEPAVAGRIERTTALVVANQYDAGAWGRLGAVYDVHDMDAEAAVCYERAWTLDEGDFRWPYLLGVCERLTRQGRAIEHFQAAAALNDEYAPLHFYLGYTLFLAEQIDEAEAHFRRAVELDPNCINGYIGLARVALARDDAEACLRELELAALLAPQSGEVPMLYAEAYRRIGNDDAAEAQALLARGRPALEPLDDPVVRAVVVPEGTSAVLLRQRSRRLLADRRLDEAAALWEQLLEDDPASAEANYQLGTLRAMAGRNDDAMAHLRRAIELRADHADAWANLGSLLVGTGRVEEAVTALQRALEIDDTLLEARNNLGGLLMQMGRRDEALGHLRAVAAAHPDRAALQFNLAMAERGAGDLEAAVASFARALEAQPDFVRARFEMGLTFGAMDRLDDAAAAFGAVLEADPSNLQAMGNLTVALTGAGRFEEAIRLNRDAVAADPDHIAAARTLAWLLATCPDDRHRDGAEALIIAQRLRETARYGDPQLLDTLAAACAETGDFDLAVQYQQRSIDIVEQRRTRAEEAGNRRQAAQDAMSRQQFEERLEVYRQQRPYRAQKPVGSTGDFPPAPPG